MTSYCGMSNWWACQFPLSTANWKYNGSATFIITTIIQSESQLKSEEGRTYESQITEKTFQFRLVSGGSSDQ